MLQPGPTARRSGVTRKGADYTRVLAGAADAELLLDLLQHGPDLADGLAEPVLVRFQGACPETERFGIVGVDLRRIGWRVVLSIYFHGVRESSKLSSFVRHGCAAGFPTLDRGLSRYAFQPCPDSIEADIFRSGW